MVHLPRKGVAVLVVAAFVVCSATAASANAPDPLRTTTGSMTANGDGSVTVSVSGTWKWGTQVSCTNRYGVGWTVDWAGISTSPTAPGARGSIQINTSGKYFHVFDTDMVAAGTVHPFTDSCTAEELALDPLHPSGTWSASHTYPSAADVPRDICANFYDLHGSPGSPGTLVARDADPLRNPDNSIRVNDFRPTSRSGFCYRTGPSIAALDPPSTTACTNCADVSLAVEGSGFEDDSVVLWDGAPLATTPSTSTEVGASIPAALIASPGTHQITVTNTSSGLSSDPVPFFVTQTTAAVTSADAWTSTDPNDSVEVSIDTPTSNVTANATGAGSVAVAAYDDNPVITPPPDGATNFFDLNVASGSFTTLIVTDCALSPTNLSHLVYWYDGTQWLPVSDQTYNPDTDCVTMTFSDVTSPTQAQLVGTPMVEIEAVPRDVVARSADGHKLRITPGDWLAAGYRFKVHQTKTTVVVQVTNASVTVPVECSKGVTTTLTVPLPPATYVLPPRSHGWVPVDESRAAAGYQGAITVPDVCGGADMRLTKPGATFAATVTTSPEVSVAITFHYRDAAASSKQNVNCADPSVNVGRGLHECTSDWSPPAKV